MTSEDLKKRNFETEFVYSMSRSSGPGGQNVNKVSSKVELRLGLLATNLFSETEKETIFKKLKNKINKDGELILISQSERTQLLNKKAVTDKFYDIVSRVLTSPLTRKSTKPTHTSKIKRLEGKRIHSNIKKLRKSTDESSNL